MQTYNEAAVTQVTKVRQMKELDQTFIAQPQQHNNKINKDRGQYK